LHYRQVNQAERWQSVDMKHEGGGFEAMIPAAYTHSAFALEYYFELRPSGGIPTQYPGFDLLFANQPYFVLQRG